jgi:hypothetical protein
LTGLAGGAEWGRRGKGGNYQTVMFLGPVNLCFPGQALER